MECRVFENFRKKIFSKFQKCPKVFPKVSKRVLNMFWGKFFEKFLPSFPWNVESSEIFEKKYFQNSKNAQKCSQKYPNVFYGDFFEKNLCPVFHGGSSFRNFPKIFFFKIPKMPKIVPKSIQTCFELALGQIFRKFFCPVFHGVSSLRIFSKKSKKVSNFLKCPKSFPKVSKRVLNVFWGKVFENFLPSFPWKVESSKIFKKNQKNCKIPKMPKIVPKSIQTCFELALGQIFRKFFCPVFHGGSRLRKTSKKIRKVSKCQKCPKLLPKVSKRVLHMFWENFLKKFMPSVPWRVESSKIFKKSKKFQIS